MQHQLFARLVLDEFFRLDYRGVEALLDESESLRAITDLRHTPDFTTLHEACRRLSRLLVLDCAPITSERSKSSKKRDSGGDFLSQLQAMTLRVIV